MGGKSEVYYSRNIKCITPNLEERKVSQVKLVVVRCGKRKEKMG